MLPRARKQTGHASMCVRTQMNRCMYKHINLARPDIKQGVPRSGCAFSTARCRRRHYLRKFLPLCAWRVMRREFRIYLYGQRGQKNTRQKKRQYNQREVTKKLNKGRLRKHLSPRCTSGQSPPLAFARALANS